jgi:hypothetical protein
MKMIRNKKKVISLFRQWKAMNKAKAFAVIRSVIDTMLKMF